jgi:hypothetical protein
VWQTERKARVEVRALRQKRKQNSEALYSRCKRSKESQNESEVVRSQKMPEKELCLAQK